MALTKVTGGLISTTSNYEVGVITATKFVGPFEGDVSGIATGTNKIKVVDESSDTTCFPLFATHSDGYLAAKSGSNLTFNSDTGALTATSFSGALTGNVDGTSDLATSVTVTANNSTDETVYPVFVDGATGTQGAETDTGLNYNPSTGNLTATKFTGNVTGNVTGNATGLSGTPSIVVQNITAEMVSVAGTMQYEDVVNVDATGIVTAGGGLVVPANKVVTITGDLNVDGKTDLDDLSVAGVSTFGGTIVANGDVNLGNSSSDDITLTGRITSDIIPSADITRDLGSSSFKWDNFWVQDINATSSNVTGLSTFTGNVDTRGDILLSGTAAGVSSVTWDASANSLIFNDDVKAKWGNGGDLQISHNAAGAGSNTIDSSAGYTYINADALRLNSKTSSWSYLRGDKSDGVVKLYKSNSEKLATSDTGISVTGEVAATQDYPNYRPTLDFNFAAVKKLDPRITFTRNTPASFHDGVGSVKFVGDNVPRFDHDIVTGECKGLFIESSGTNYSLYSRRFDTVATGSWVPVNGGATPTVTANTYTAPDGTPTSSIYSADTITGATGTAYNGNVVKQQYTAASNVKHTFSLYIKLLTATQATIYIRDGGTGSGSSTSAVNTKNWQRVVVTSSAALTNATAHSFYIGNTNGTIAVWGSQIENKSSASSYMTTDSSTGSRGADMAVIDGQEFIDTYSPTEGSFIIDASVDDLATGNQAIFGAENESNRSGWFNMIGYRVGGNSSGKAAAWYMYNGGGAQGYLNGDSSGTLTAGIPFKAAYRYKYNDFAFTCNGGTVITDTSGPTVDLGSFDRFVFGSYHYAAMVSGHIRRVTVYSKALLNSQLLTLTS